MHWNHSELLVVIDEAIEKNSTINNLKSDVAILKSDVAILKSDVAILKSDVAILKSDVAILKSDVQSLTHQVNHHSVLIAANTKAIDRLTSEQFRLNGLMEDMGSDIKKLVEMLLPSKRRDEQFDRLDITVEQHENRLCAVEATIKDRFAKSP
jgi:outer membrane murein-binding lipoprotein Lpp